MRILIVEDDANVRSFLQRAIKALRPKAKVDTANHGADGLKLARRHGYDLIITDYHMPRMNGLDLIQSLFQEGYFLPVVVISADYSVANESLLAGASYFLAKPITMEDLNQMLANFGL